jgi:hypothetical protein
MQPPRMHHNLWVRRECDATWKIRREMRISAARLALALTDIRGTALSLSDLQFRDFIR